MLPIPAGVLAGLSSALPVRARAEYTTDRATWLPLTLVDGSVTADRTADTRYTASITVTDPPDGLRGFTTLVRLFRGVRLPRSHDWWCPAGVYTVSRLSVQAGVGTVELDGLEALIRDQNLPQPLVVGPGTAGDVVDGLVSQVVKIPTWFDRVDPGSPIDRIVVDTSRWDVLSAGETSTGDTIGIASALGAECFVNAGGVFTMSAVPAVGDPTVWTFDRASVLTVEPASEYTTDGVFNVVAATGDKGDGSPVVGPEFVWDDEESSSTYAGINPVGDPAAAVAAGARLSVLLYSSPLITNVTMARQAAAAQLANSLGASTSINLQGVVNPALEPGDVVSVEVRPGVFQPHLIDSLTVDLTGADMTCTTRATVARVT